MNRACWLALAVLLGCPAPARAHRLKVFAAAEGTAISGYVYFPGGGRARGVKVLVFGPQDRLLGTLTTDDAGEFTFKATRRCDHKFVADSGDGHRAEFPVGAHELAGDLAALEAAPATPALPSPAPSSPARGGALPSSGLSDAVSEAVARQIRPLREQIEQLEETRQFRDILGGIGYVFGIMGLILFFKSWAKQRRG